MEQNRTAQIQNAIRQHLSERTLVTRLSLGWSQFPIITPNVQAALSKNGQAVSSEEVRGAFMGMGKEILSSVKHQGYILRKQALPLMRLMADRNWRGYSAGVNL